MARDHLQMLDLAANGKWDEAHRLAQQHTDTRSYLIHGYLHRVEGDLANAAYWYHRAGETIPQNSLQEEWKRLFESMAG